MHEKLKQLKNNPKDVEFADLSKVCEFYFGKPRQSTSSHRKFKTPWQTKEYKNERTKKNPILSTDFCPDDHAIKPAGSVPGG